MNVDLAAITRIYTGSDGDATKALYAQLEALGPRGVIAVNVFRATKCSERAKVYRGGIPGKGSYRSAAYERKQWSMTNLCRALETHAAALGIRWGWAEDPEQAINRWVLYCDLPTGQVSFHTAARGVGPLYTGEWDGIRGAGPGRVCRFAAALLASVEVS
jgi:hypothetical protein